MNRCKWNHFRVTRKKKLELPEEQKSKQKNLQKKQSIDIKASINLVQHNLSLFAIVIKHEFCIMYNQRKSASLLNADEKQKPYYDPGNI